MSKTLCVDDTIESLIARLEGYEEGEALKFVWKFFKQQSEAILSLHADKEKLERELAEAKAIMEKVLEYEPPRNKDTAKMYEFLERTQQ